MIKRILQTIPVFLLTFALFFHPIMDFSQDLGRHIKLGEIILTTHSVPKINLFAYSYPNFPFINTHWLSEVIFYLINSHFGSFGLLLTMSSIAALSISILVYFCLHTKYKIPNTRYFSVALTALLYLGILLERTYLRPEIFSFFFVSIFMVILYCYRNSIKQQVLSIKQERKTPSYFILNPKYWLFALPLIEAAWVNMHIYFIVGPLLVFLFFIDAIIQSFLDSREKNSKQQETSNKKIPNNKIQYKNIFGKLRFICDLYLGNWSLLLVLTLTALTTLFNPNGLTGALYPLHVFQNYGYAIAENQSLFFLLTYGFRNVSYAYFGIAAIGGFCLLLFRRKETKLVDWLLFITFTILAFSATRNFPLFVFATFIPFATLLSSLFRHSERSEESLPSRQAGHSKKYPSNEVTSSQPSVSNNKNRNTKVVWLSLSIIGTVLLIYFSIQKQGFGYSIQPGEENAVNFFLTHHLKGPIFNNFDIGSYLDYRLYPKEGVFVDGRPEAFPVDFFQNEYIPMQEDAKIFEKVDKKYHFNTIFFTYTDQTPWATTFVETILKTPSWKLIYLDATSMILVKNIPQNPQQAFTESDITSGKIVLPNDYDSLLQETKIIDILQWRDAEIIVLQKMLAQNPHSCFALATLANLLTQKNDPTVGIYASQYQQFCQ